MFINVYIFINIYMNIYIWQPVVLDRDGKVLSLKNLVEARQWQDRRVSSSQAVKDTAIQQKTCGRGGSGDEHHMRVYNVTAPSSSAGPRWKIYIFMYIYTYI